MIFPVIEARLRYKSPARYDDLLAIEVWPTLIERVRVNFGHRIVNQDGKLILEAETFHVCTGVNEKPKRLPEELAANSSRLLNAGRLEIRLNRIRNYVFVPACAPRSRLREFSGGRERTMQNYPKHYCGVFGIFGHPNAAELTYYGLYALQHRGQESAGIVTCHEGKFFKHHGMGLVPQVFNPKILHDLVGNMAIGHTRYSTTGSSHIRNAQPLTVDCMRGQIAVAHNGNLTNAAQLRDDLESRGLVFQTTVDSEIIIMMLAQPSLGGVENTLVQTFRRLEGAYSLVIMTEKELIGARDPFGFRPLSIGRLNGAYVLASESVAFDQIQAEFVRDVEPGEIVIINEKGLISIQAFPEHQRRAFCIFEYVYFARPDSVIGGRSVYEVRKEMGRQLAREHRVKADLVIPVPDSGVCAALGYSEKSGIPFEMAFIRNHYVGRSFLQPSQLIRDFDVRVKLNLIASLVKNKRVVIVDDSIVRGTTCKARVKTLKEAGAREVHVAGQLSAAHEPVRLWH